MAKFETSKQVGVFSILCGGLFAYAAWGAVNGRIWFPSKTEVYLEGFSAWAMVAGTLAWFISSVLLVREMSGDGFAFGRRVGGSLLIFGVICLVAARFFLPGVIYGGSK
jgi:hypothetical protein